MYELYQIDGNPLEKIPIMQIIFQRAERKIKMWIKINK